MLVLAVDTSTPVVTAGVVRVPRPHEVMAAAWEGGGAAAPPVPPVPTVLPGAELTRTDAFGHAEHLMPLVAAALAAAGAGLADLDAVVVGLGPGPFTGLRVGIATAQALGDARSIPVFGVPSHDGFALTATHPATTDPAAPGRARPDPDAGFLVATDARRREVYVSGYRGGRRVIGPLVAAPGDVADLLPDDLVPSWITGAGAELLAGPLGLPIREIAGPVSNGLVRAALRALVAGAVPGPLTPLYLRRPDATVPGAPKPVLAPRVWP